MVAEAMEILHRSHLARICVSEVAGVSVSTPLLIVSGSEESMGIRAEGISRIIHWGELRIIGDQKITPPVAMGSGAVCHHDQGLTSIRLPLPEDLEGLKGKSMVIVENMFELRRDPKAMASSLSEVRRVCGPETLLMATGIAEPSNMALLFYMGVDVIDDTLAKSMAARGILLRPEGRFHSDAPLEELERANQGMMQEELELVKAFLVKDRLRELVDQRACSSPSNVVALRSFDSKCWENTEEYVPVIGTRFACNTPQSLFRPDVVRHRTRVLQRYRAPAHKRILVLLPCSAKKPYFTSRSHRRFIEAIRSGDHFSLVHEVIVTSPLGLVPRELETFYPAAHYDIPVSGEWTSEEVSMINGMLKSYLETNHYDQVFSHLGDDGLLTQGIELTDTSLGSPGSDEALRNLDDGIRRACSEHKRVPGMIDRVNTMESMLRYQMGDVGPALIEGCEVIGKYPYWKVMEGKRQLAMHTPDRGMASLTIEGADRILAEKRNLVHIEDFKLKGNVFAVGVYEADPLIRIGDEVVVVQGDSVAAVGVAQMSGSEMVALSRGIAVKVRHKSK